MMQQKTKMENDMKKNLIFDVGDVLIGYRWKEMLTDDFGLSDERAEQIGGLIFNDPIWPEFDRGLVSIDELVEHYCERLPEEAWMVRRFFYGEDLMAVRRDKVWDRVDELKQKGYRIFILSNYSEFLFRKHTDGLPFRDSLDGGIVSYQVNLIKPEPEIYKHLLEKYSLDPDDCIFYDDRDDNVEAARALGIEAVVITSEEMLLDELAKL